MPIKRFYIETSVAIIGKQCDSPTPGEKLRLLHNSCMASKIELHTSRLKDGGEDDFKR